MLLGRIRQVRRKNDHPVEVKRDAIPELDDYLIRRDYTGAMAMLEFKRKEEPHNAGNNLWLGHCAFHAGEYTKALEVYEWMLSLKECPSEVYVYLGCCFFFMGRHKEAQDAAEKGSKSALQNRLLLLINHRRGIDSKVLSHHAQLRDSIEDQCCLATINYMRQHFHDAQEIYKKLVESNESFHAINIYLAMCMYRQDFFDHALKLTNDYLNTHNDSVTVLNLKAACLFRLYDGERAMAELKRIPENAFATHYSKHILKHNLVVFQNGEAALQVLPALVDIVPEARANLIIFHMRRRELSEAQTLAMFEPKMTTDFLLKAIVLSALAYHKGQKDTLEQAAEYFRRVGESQSECDTITGRQCMASYHFLTKNFEEVVIYLNSIKDYFKDDPVFNFNYGQAQLWCSKYEEAEGRLAAVTGDEITDDPLYMQNLARAHIMSKNPNLAWEFYQRKRNNKEVRQLLEVIANDSYRSGYFYYAAKAYDALEKITSNDLWLAKRGACAGLFQQVVNRRAPVQQLEEILGMLEKYNTSQAMYMITTISKWMADNKQFLGGGF